MPAAQPGSGPAPWPARFARLGPGSDRLAGQQIPGGLALTAATTINQSG